MDPKILREATLAYQAVYNENLRQELTEEQIWEQVENWVNSLLEEGHDLSEYTWEDMYESYLNEMGQPGGNTPGGPRPDPAYNRSRFARPRNANTVTRGRGGIRRPQIGGLGGLGPGYRGAELATAAKARASQVSTPRQGTAGGPTVGGNTPIRPAKTPATKPVAPATKPAAAAAPVKPAPTATAKPTPPATAKPAPKPGTQAAGPESIKPKTPNPLMKDMPKGPGSMAAPTPAPKRFDIRDRDPRARANFDPRFDKKPINQSFDLFDVIKGHLLDEGYADTEDAALAIMANMSEQWKQSILEG